jgi:hypothetical protein
MDEFKRTYSNNDTLTVALPYFWQHFEKEFYSIWYCEYKYADELQKVFMTSNLIGGITIIHSFFFHLVEDSERTPPTLLKKKQVKNTKAMIKNLGHLSIIHETNSKNNALLFFNESFAFLFFFFVNLNEQKYDVIKFNLTFVLPNQNVEAF